MQRQIKNRKTPFDPDSTDYYEKAKFLVDDVINQAQVKKKPGGLPDITYQNGTAMSKKKHLRVYQVEVVKYLENYLVK